MVSRETRTVSRPFVEISTSVGDTRISIEAAVRMDGLVLLKVGEYDALCCHEQLSDLIEVLLMVFK